MKPPYLKLALWIIGYLVVSFTIGQLTQGGIQGWYQDLQKPALNPPNWIFPIMWSVLYVMIATTGWLLWEKGAGTGLKTLFIAYTLMNWLWSPLFFGLHQTAFAFAWIMMINALNLAFIIKAWFGAPTAAKLMISPLLWTSFAAYLNLAIWLLNR